MLRKSLRVPHMLFFFTLIVFMLAVMALFYFYHSSGLSNGGHVASIYEASTKIDELKNKSDLDDIRLRVEEDQAREAIRNFDQLTKVFSTFKSLKATRDSYEELDSQSGKVRTALNKLISLPEARGLIKVLEEKAEKFLEFSAENKWRTLHRMSSRIHTRLVKVGNLNAKKINEILRESKQDLSIMRNVTESSVLAREDKSLVLMRLSTFDAEMKMLEQYLADQQNFMNVYDGYKSFLKKWINRIGPELSLARMQVDREAKLFIIYQMGLIGLCLAMMVLGALVLGRNRKRAERKLEDELGSLVHDGLLKKGSALAVEGSPQFMSGLQNAKNYVQKRMSFSSIFQEALPFSSILLDSNLKVIWANPSFCEHWKIGPQDIDSESLSWDYIVRYTNLAGNDPVIEALRAGLAGIYQIQVRVDHNSPKVSYEMYVCPVEYATEHTEQRRIMIFFYPLTHLEETISGHARTLMSPVRKSIEALAQNNFSAQFRSQVQKDFEVAEIPDVYEKFCHYDDYNKAQYHGLMKEIERLENIVADNHQLFHDLKGVNTEQLGESQQFARGLEDFKDQMVTLASYCDDLSLLNQETSDMVLRSVKQLKGSLHMTRSCLERVSKASENLSSVEEAKNQIKAGREELREAKEKILLTLDQALIFQKSAETDPLRMEQVFGKIKADIRAMDKYFGQFDKSCQTLEIKLSKMQMMMENPADQPPLDDVMTLAKELSTYDYELQEKMTFNQDLSLNMKVMEERIVKRVKDLYDVCKRNLERGHRVEGIISHEIEDREVSLMGAPVEQRGSAVSARPHLP